MSNAFKIVVPLVLLAAIAGGGAYYLSQSGHDSPPPAPPSTPAASSPVEQKPAEEPAKPSTAEPVTQDPVREAAKASSGSVNADAAQGLRGRVVRPDGQPVPEATVVVLESGINDMIQTFLDQRTGKVKPSIATVQTDGDGVFVIGMYQTAKSVDVRVVTNDFPELSRNALKVREGNWYNMGDLKLDVGVVVQGRVVEAGSKAPIAQAVVYLAASSQSGAVVPTPGRERGIATTTDANGSFRFANGPRTGVVNIVAEAPGYASAQLINHQLKQDTWNEVTLELELGQPIAGVVVDQDGKPIANARVQATGLSSKTPQNATTVSLEDGRFEFPTLRTGPYQLLATSPAHSDGKDGMVLTGSLDVKLVQSLKSIVKLKVLAANGSPVKTYKLGLKRFYPQNPLGIGNVPEFVDRRVNPSDYSADFGGEWAVIRGVPSGEFRFQIEDTAHAKTLSPNFTVVDGGVVTEVVAELTLGAAITGTVVDDRGQPVAGASVSTDMNGGIAADSDFLNVFRTMMPEKHSKASTKTDSQGRFRIAKLAYSDYMVRVSHPSYCEGSAINLKLEAEGQTVDAGAIVLSPGTIVEGATLIDGMPAGQVRVSISMPMGEVLPNAEAATSRTAKVLFNANVISDGDGRYRVLKRVPPGVYKVTAARESVNSPFDKLLDMKETEQRLEIRPGQDRVEVNFALSRR